MQCVIGPQFSNVALKQKKLRLFKNKPGNALIANSEFRIPNSELHIHSNPWVTPFMRTRARARHWLTHEPWVSTTAIATDETPSRHIDYIGERSFNSEFRIPNSEFRIAPALWPELHSFFVICSLMWYSRSPCFAGTRRMDARRRWIVVILRAWRPESV